MFWENTSIVSLTEVNVIIEMSFSSKWRNSLAVTSEAKQNTVSWLEVFSLEPKLKNVVYAK